MFVCALGSRRGGGGPGGSYLFVLPSRRVREQIKGFSLGRWGNTPRPFTSLLDEGKHMEELGEIKTNSFVSEKSHHSEIDGQVHSLRGEMKMKGWETGRERQEVMCLHSDTSSSHLIFSCFSANPNCKRRQN